MQKSQILQEAIRRNLNMKQIGEDCASAFALVHQCIGSICTMDLTEEEKKEKLIRSMQSFWRGKGRLSSVRLHGGIFARLFGCDFRS